MTKRVLTAITSLALLNACQAYPTAPATGAPVLQGRADFPGYAVQATSGDVTGHATVSLIDDAGVARMAGVTDASGHFTLFQSTTPFSPQPGDAFTLNVTKRVTTGGTNRLLTLRTAVLRGSAAWNSITGSTVVVNMATTAAVKFDEQHADVDLEDLLGVVSGNAITRPIGAHPALEADALKTLLDSQLSFNNDPSSGLVYDGDVTLTDRASIDAIAGYDVIQGQLTVRLDPGITTLNLPNLKKVTSYVGISGENGGNADLENLDGLSNLTSAGILSIYGNPKLKSLQGLRGLTRLTEGGLSVQGNAELTSTAGLENLEVLGTSQSFGGDLTITHNERLTTVAPMKLTAVPGMLSLESNPLVTSYAGLGLIEAVGGRMQIEANNAMTTIGLSALKTVGDEITVEDNPAMTNVGLPALSTCTKGLGIVQNDGLSSLAGLESLTTVGNNLSVSMNAKLDNLGGLGSLTSVANQLLVSDNPKLTSLTGLNGNVTAFQMFVMSNGLLDTDCGQAPLSTITSTKFVFGNHLDVCE